MCMHRACLSKSLGVITVKNGIQKVIILCFYLGLSVSFIETGCSANGPIKPVASSAHEPVSWSTLVGIGLLGYIAYCVNDYFDTKKELFTRIPEVTINDDSTDCPEGDPMPLYKWRLQALENYDFSTPAKMMHAEGENQWVSHALVEDYNARGRLDIYNGQGHKVKAGSRTIEDLLSTIQKELRMLEKHMLKLRPYTDIPAMYKKASLSIHDNVKQTAVSGPQISTVTKTNGNAKSKPLHEMTREQESKIFEEIHCNIYKEKTEPLVWYQWQWWQSMYQKVMHPLRQEANQKFWDLFVAQERLKTLEKIINSSSIIKRERANNKAELDRRAQKSAERQPRSSGFN